MVTQKFVNWFALLNINLWCFFLAQLLLRAKLINYFHTYILHQLFFRLLSENLLYAFQNFQSQVVVAHVAANSKTFSVQLKGTI